MNRAPRAIALALVVALGAFAGAISFGPSVSAREPLPARTPKPHPKKTPTPTPTPTPSPTPTPTPTKTSDPRESSTSKTTSDADGSTQPAGSAERTRDRATKAAATSETDRERETRKTGIWWDIRPSFGGRYSTATLMDLEEDLRERGASTKVLRRVYAPFIIGGAAEFSDTWGAVRHDVHNTLRPHLGQDVFCEYGAPVLAAETGTVEFVRDRLGGTVVRLHRTDGGYWYYAHLSEYADELRSGDSVETGDVIGYCGDSGNASGGSPHVHFGSYPGPVNPMGDLVTWLESAEQRARKALFRLTPEKEADVGLAVNLLAVDRCPRSKTPVEDVASPLELLLATG